MATPTMHQPRTADQPATQVDPTYPSTLRYLSDLARAESEDRRRGPVTPTGPELVRDVMTPAVVAAHEGAVFKEIVDALVRNRISAVPVVDERRRVIGVVSESDLLARVSGGHLTLPPGHRLSGRSEIRRKLQATTAQQLMTAPPVLTTPDTPIAEAAALVARSHVRRLPVVDGDGVLVGVVSRGDLLRTFLRPDAEIRADIVQNVVVGAFVLPADAVGVEVIEGVVTLSGVVERRLLAESLIASVRLVSGVVDVDPAGLTYRINDTPLATPTPMY